MKIHRKHIIIIVLLALSAGLAYDSISNYVNPYTSVTDISLNKAQYSGKSLQLIGEVKPGSLIRSDDGSISFTLTDEGGSIKVTYRGIPPQNLEQEGSQIVVLGTLESNGEIESNKLLVKCPSKYEGEGEQGISHVFMASIGIALLGLGYIIVTTIYRKS
jgi:cytochrome c-type biogenesis protein CcmE